jgi:hypothetical protein
VHGELRITCDCRHAFDLTVARQDKHRGDAWPQAAVLQRLVPERRPAQHDGVGLSLVGIEQSVDMVEVLVDVDQHGDTPLRLEPFRQLLEQRQFVRVREVVDEHGNLVGQIGRQAPGQQIRGVVPLFCRLEHLFTTGLSD